MEWAIGLGVAWICIPFVPLLWGETIDRENLPERERALSLSFKTLVAWYIVSVASVFAYAVLYAP